MVAPVYVVAMIPPGRFPTVVPDPGAWWDGLAAQDGVHLDRASINAAWWRVLCRPGVSALLAVPQCIVRVLETSAERAERALAALTDPATFSSAARYVAATTPLAEHVALLNDVQTELDFSLGAGVRVRGLNYHDSGALAAFA